MRPINQQVLHAAIAAAMLISIYYAIIGLSVGNIGLSVTALVVEGIAVFFDKYIDFARVTDEISVETGTLQWVE